MNTRQMKAVAASMLGAATLGLAILVTSTPANAWPCVPRCGTPVPSSTVGPVSPSGPGQVAPSPVPINPSTVVTVGPGGVSRR